MGVHVDPSLMHTLPGSCGLSSLLDEVQTLPGHCTQCLVGVHIPGLVPVFLALSEMMCRHSPVKMHCPLWVCTLPIQCTHSLVNGHTPWMGGWLGGEETGAVDAGEFPKVRPRIFFFLGISSRSILWLPLYKEGPVLSHSPPLQLVQGLSGSGSHRTQLSTLPSQYPWSLWVYHFVLTTLPETSSNQVSLGAAQALFGRRGSC